MNELNGPVRWGILGPGAIAGSFADDLLHVAGAQLVAVGSRDRERAIAFAARRSIPYAHGSYEALANDPNVDVVYIATPHSRHVEDAILCLRAGKHVLVEKPIAMSADGARQIQQAAVETDRFATEAMWTRFFPLFAKVRELIISGRIGSVIELRADFGHANRVDPTGRLWNPALGGGALLDIGVYPLTWATGLLGWPASFDVDASFAITGVDEAIGIRLTHEGGATSLLHASQRRRTLCQVVIDGTEGRIVVHGPMFAPRRVTLSAHGGAKKSTVWNRSLADLDRPGSPLLGMSEHVPAQIARVWESGPARKVRNRIAEQFSRSDEPLIDLEPGAGYRYEAAAATSSIRHGHRSCVQLPLSDSVKMMELLDAIRQRIGLVYPSD